MDDRKTIPQLTEKEKQSLDKQIARLEPKVFKAHQEYESLISQLAELQYKRYPERREEYIKELLYDTYRKSTRTLDEVVSFMQRKNEDDEDEFW